MVPVFCCLVAITLGSGGCWSACLQGLLRAEINQSLTEAHIIVIGISATVLLLKINSVYFDVGC